MKRTLLILLFMAANCSQAQNNFLFTQNPFARNDVKVSAFNAKDTSSKWKDKITFGGAVSVNFGTYTFLLLNPQLIYKVNENTWIGAGPYIQYMAGPLFRSSIYGANIFGRKYVLDNVFLQAEYNLLNFNNSSTTRTTGHYGMAGGGYAPNRNISITVMYIFTADPNGYLPYGGSPWVIRGGIYF